MGSGASAKVVPTNSTAVVSFRSRVSGQFDDLPPEEEIDRVETMRGDASPRGHTLPVSKKCALPGCANLINAEPATLLFCFDHLPHPSAAGFTSNTVFPELSPFVLLDADTLFTSLSSLPQFGAQCFTSLPSLRVSYSSLSNVERSAALVCFVSHRPVRCCTTKSIIN